MFESIAAQLRTLDYVKTAEASNEQILVKIESDARGYELHLDCSCPFPRQLPRIYLVSADQYGFLPHVCWAGEVCFSDRESLHIDTYRPIDVVVYSLNSVTEILFKAENGILDAFYDEFEGYWNSQKDCLECHLFFDLEGGFREVELYENKKLRPESIACFRKDKTLRPGYSFFDQRTSSKTLIRGCYIPLKHHIDPPLPGSPLGLDFITRVLDAMEVSDLCRWNRFIQGNKVPKRLTLIMAQPRPSGGQSLYGLHLSAKALVALKNKEPYAKPLIPLGVKRHSYNYLVRRGGNAEEPLDSKVVVIGCGALGSRVAELFAMEGIRHLTLVDGDSFSESNLFRHLLDSQFIGLNKAGALAKNFIGRFPGINVSAMTCYADSLKDFINDSDLIVVATGNPTVELAFSREYQASNCKEHGCLLTTWLEVGGVGGHSVLSTKRTQGCLHCLYHRDGTPSLISVTSLIRPNQVVTKNLTGCGGAFVPYGAIHALKTATMVVEQALAVIADQTPVSGYRSWSSRENLARTALQGSDWFNESLKEGANQQIEQLLAEGCPVCRGQ